jgi:hemerythrin-like metal-binding protein
MFIWNDKHNVNISIIDEDHRKFIDIVNKAIAAKQQNKNTEQIEEVLNEMINHALNHFKTEEKYMIEINYPEYQYHKEEHLDFSFRTISYLKRVVSGDHQIANKILEYLKQWLARHIQVTDRKYIECFKKNGLK